MLGGALPGLHVDGTGEEIGRRSLVGGAVLAVGPVAVAEVLSFRRRGGAGDTLGRGTVRAVARPAPL